MVLLQLAALGDAEALLWRLVAVTDAVPVLASQSLHTCPGAAGVHWNLPRLVLVAGAAPLARQLTSLPPSPVPGWSQEGGQRGQETGRGSGLLDWG